MSLGKGSGKKGSGEVRGQDFRGIVTHIRRLCLYANIGGPDLENIILINVPALFGVLIFGSRGDKSYGLSLISPGCYFVAIWPRQFKSLVIKAQSGPTIARLGYLTLIWVLG